jgi:hypothetical protein
MYAMVSVKYSIDVSFHYFACAIPIVFLSLVVLASRRPEERNPVEIRMLQGDGQSRRQLM